MLSKSKKIKLIIAIIFIVLFLGGLIYSSYNMFTWKKDVDRNNKTQKEVNKNVKKKKNKYEIDFKTLKEQNKDTIAYLKVDGTKIDYVVVQGTDNKYYLNRNFNNEYNVAGWIFADYNNTFDGTDNNIVIYGHNTTDGSMFGTLKDTQESEWQKNKDHEIVLVTEQGEYYYQVFSTYNIEPEDYYIKTHFSDDDKYMNFLNDLKARSNYDYKVELNRNDKILTLSSCTLNGAKRVVLHAKLIKIN